MKKKDTGRVYAMKVIRKEAVIEKNAVEHTLAEHSVLKKLTHPFIVNLKYSFQTKDKLFMVMDYVAGGSFTKFAPRTKTFLTQTIFRRALFPPWKSLKVFRGQNHLLRV